MAHITQDEAVEILAALGVADIMFDLSGSGDSGTVEFNEIAWLDARADGTPVVRVDLNTIPHTSRTHAHVDGKMTRVSCSLMEALTDAVGEWPEGDWYNNEGGQGTVSIRPFDEDPVYVDMEYNDGNDDDDEDEDSDVLDGEIGLEPEHGGNAAEGVGFDPDAGFSVADEPDPAPGGPRR